MVRCQCYKNTAVIYHGKLPWQKTLLFLGLKYNGNLLSYCSYLPSFQGKYNVINIPMVIYCHSTEITKVMLLYNTEWWFDHGIVVNYSGKKFYNIGPRCQCYKMFYLGHQRSGLISASLILYLRRRVEPTRVHKYLKINHV